MKILINFPFDKDQVEAFRQLAHKHGEHEVLQAGNEAEALSLAAEIEVLLGDFPPPLCAAAPNLRWIQSSSAGMDKRLYPEIIEREVEISNMAAGHAPQGAEHAWALLLALSRGIPQFLADQARKEWTARPVVEVTGGTLGLIGLGGFGLEMAKRAAGYDMTLLALDPVRTDKPEGIAELKPSTRENLHALLRRSDVVMLACPLTSETYHLIGPEELALMKETAYLINVTRGGIIDEAALIEALEKGQIAGAGLDVCEEEPLPPDDPLWNAPNLIITPHRAGFSQHRPGRVFDLFYGNLERYLKGERPLNIIDKKRGF